VSLGRSQHHILDIHRCAEFSDLLLAVTARATPAPRGVRAVMHDGEMLMAAAALGRVASKSISFSYVA
jgi:hypothetical protein